ncbi:hypothetical protein ASD8599_01765 [Ascidiaceihabitans donghaensis]|uniref:Uncharacterized protein n=1 Tax=Ascidiaceihabitans donghaensis TaxID=1510460 RepID=A0A2R8BD75_9RHOB|nr:hypothetical protein [Ascidiaceihabitans donghaensis]SPH21024.1 hypothetical protein ASD8599_01765 [Ascidiaceihabitans donghaensis]
MLERGEIQKSFRHDGVLIIIFNALAFDLLVVGYGQHEDGTEIKELLSAMTLASFFEAALVVLFAFTSYVVIAKEPLIWILSRLYFCVIFLRVVCYPFWRAGYSEQLSKDALKIARSDWKAFVDYQLNVYPEGANWKAN